MIVIQSLVPSGVATRWAVTSLIKDRNDNKMTDNMKNESLHPNTSL